MSCLSKLIVLTPPSDIFKFIITNNEKFLIKNSSVIEVATTVDELQKADMVVAARGTSFIATIESAESCRRIRRSHVTIATAIRINCIAIADAIKIVAAARSSGFAGINS